ncbi:MAG: hypothetical protein A3F84_11620 [Candidatus Handelsmanbacteria bacterium RIFCSPLOWO2_12_FULL_64_10]|uniref:Lipoprotein LpqB beta-propeller domain-containing protein n=1 Tax=Handelsmanbacteria sp. (strain RIFCSPLOWO2_12_FULL_64_10) TaxID=1817868 RepID=A0A1F6CAB2_HANXR|nr:MAG: hypothetical protein A3F84_11620 [Candidatus Handelsmanbacteria bacterium RIFCSPLOWO2_12_FULL_64_10]
MVAGVGLAVHQHTLRQSGLTPNVPVAAPQFGGRLLYTRDGGLWTLNLADGVATEVAAAPELGQVTAARWSPDGRSMVYAVHEVRNRRTPVSTVIVAAADGSNPRPVVGSEDASTFYQLPAWARDGQHIYVVHTAQNVKRIEEVELATGVAKAVVDELGQFDVSPDGRWLVVARSTNTGIGLLLVDLATGAQRDLVGEQDFDLISSPRFDPGSQIILFTGAGRAGAQVSRSGGVGGLPGPEIALAHGIPMDLFSMPVGGGTPRRVARVNLDDPTTSWSPDGSNAALFSYEALQIVRLADGSLTPLLTPGGFGSVDWAR